MSFREEFGPLLTGEIVNLTFDYTGLLGFGETITSARITAAVYSGDDDNPANILNGALSIVGSKVQQRVSPPIPGNIYILTCAAVTNNAQSLKLQGYLAVLPEDPSNVTFSSNPPTIIAPTAGRFSNYIGNTVDGHFSECHFIPFNGNQISISGFLYTIPAGVIATSGGIKAQYANCSVNKVIGQTLANNTDYWVYVYWNGVELVLDFSQYSHTCSAVDGVEVKGLPSPAAPSGGIFGTPDRSCTLVGYIHTSSAGKTYGTAHQQTAVSWFNRLRYFLFNQIAGATGTSGVWLVLGNGTGGIADLEWVQWADDLPMFNIIANVGSTVAATQVSLICSLDGGVTPNGSPASTIPTIISPGNPTQSLFCQGYNPGGADLYMHIAAMGLAEGPGLSEYFDGHISVFNIAV